MFESLSRFSCNRDFSQINYILLQFSCVFTFLIFVIPYCKMSRALADSIHPLSFAFLSPSLAFLSVISHLIFTIFAFNPSSPNVRQLTELYLNVTITVPASVPFYLLLLILPGRAINNGFFIISHLILRGSFSFAYILAREFLSRSPGEEKHLCRNSFSM